MQTPTKIFFKIFWIFLAIFAQLRSEARCASLNLNQNGAEIDFFFEDFDWETIEAMVALEFDQFIDAKKEQFLEESPICPRTAEIYLVEITERQYLTDPESDMSHDETCQIIDHVYHPMTARNSHFISQFDLHSNIEGLSVETLKNLDSHKTFDEKGCKNTEFNYDFITTTEKYLQVLLIILILKLPGEGVTNAEIVRLKKYRRLFLKSRKERREGRRKEWRSCWHCCTPPRALRR